MTKRLPDILFENDPRVRVVGTGTPDFEGKCVLYWMQRAQRGIDNPALDIAIGLGTLLRRPVLAVFGLTANYPSAQRRHYRFLVEGLMDAKADLLTRGVPLVVRLGRPEVEIPALARETKAVVVVGDENPVRIGREWRDLVSRALSVPLCLVDADVVVPTSLFPKEEYAARTIRPKIHGLWDQYLRPLPRLLAQSAWNGAVPDGATVDVEGLMKRLRVGGASEVPTYRGGTREALGRLTRFIEDRLDSYATRRNEPTPCSTSELSAHLHFGQISPLTMALAVRESGLPMDDQEAFLEELIVRRELAVNFVARNPDYDRLDGCPKWARKTLEKHAKDPRPYLYSAEELEAAFTHDPLWNAAQKEMMLTGRMHNYLRMYWAKKILEWSPDAETAYAVAVDLNDRYEMDGRDPNGYAGIAWAIGGKHDRPWPERPIFGTVRYMSYESTRRKFDSTAYIARIEAIERSGERVRGVSSK